MIGNLPTLVLARSAPPGVIDSLPNPAFGRIQQVTYKILIPHIGHCKLLVKLAGEGCSLLMPGCIDDENWRVVSEGDLMLFGTVPHVVGNLNQVVDNISTAR